MQATENKGVLSSRCTAHFSSVMDRDSTTTSGPAVVHFRGMVLDLRTGELRRDGALVQLQPQPAKILALLVRRAGEVVSREEIAREVWGTDTFVDFEQGLNYAIRQIRSALEDNAENPSFVETLPKRGYRFIAPLDKDKDEKDEAEEEPVASGVEAQTLGGIQEAKRPRSSRLLLYAAVAVVVLLLAYLFRPGMPLPRVSRVEQLTKSGGAWFLEPLYTDGPRVYYNSIGPLPADWQVRQVLLNGNEDSLAGISFARFHIRGLSPDDTEFLASSFVDEQWTVWRIPVAGGSPRRVGNLVAGDGDIAWSHDGSLIAYNQGNQLFLAKSDATAARSLAMVPDGSAAISHIRWSPDDRRLRFTVSTPTTRALWEVGADGRNLHELRFNWPGPEMECCGEWTVDGRYFVFTSRREGLSNLWALEERVDWWRRPNRDPVQLTSGPVNYFQPIFSRNGKSIFAVGVQASGEMVRYDSGRKEFVPFLNGRSNDRLTFSHDGQWVAYVAYPEGTLWRARSDGTEQLQLTFPPLQVGSPHWSADGKRIAFEARQPGQLWKDFLISAEGGNPEPFPPEPLSQANGSWMPGRDALIYSRSYGAENPGLYQFDLRSGRSEKIPGTDGLYGPLWSPDGRHLSAVDAATDHLLLVDPKTGKRTQLAGSVQWPSWSADSQYIYYSRFGFNWIFRVHVPDGTEEKFLQVPFRGATGAFTLAPDNSPILLREHGRYDVYALYLSFP
jgi:DNA-binding winged helix-turn-helix (wHTH) protein/Tol biopolymer transport system component